MKSKPRRQLLVMGIFCCFVSIALASFYFWGECSINKIHAISKSSPTKKHPQYAAIYSLAKKFPMPAKEILDLLGKPDLSTRKIIHWSGSTLNADSQVFDPPITEWWLYRGDHAGFYSPIVALFDPPTEQWWYFEGANRDYNNTYFFLVSRTGQILDCEYQPIPKLKYSNWQEFPLKM